MPYLSVFQTYLPNRTTMCMTVQGGSLRLRCSSIWTAKIQSAVKHIVEPDMCDPSEIIIVGLWVSLHFAYYLFLSLWAILTLLWEDIYFQRYFNSSEHKSIICIKYKSPNHSVLFTFMFIQLSVTQKYLCKSSLSKKKSTCGQVTAKAMLFCMEDWLYLWIYRAKEWTNFRFLDEWRYVFCHIRRVTQYIWFLPKNCISAIKKVIKIIPLNTVRRPPCCCDVMV